MNDICEEELLALMKKISIRLETGVRQLKINKCSECGLIAAFFVSSLFIYLLYGCCTALYFMV